MTSFPNSTAVSQADKALNTPRMVETASSSQSSQQQHLPNDANMSAAARALRVPEIVEAILLRTEPCEVVLMARTGKAFNEVVKTSPRVQTRLGYQVQGPIHGRWMPPMFNLALFPSQRHQEDALFEFGHWSVRVVLYEPRLEPVFDGWSLGVSARYHHDYLLGSTYARERWRDLPSTSARTMLLVNPAVTTSRFNMQIPDVPESAYDHDERVKSMHTFGDVVEYLLEVEFALTTPFWEGWFKHWDRKLADWHEEREEIVERYGDRQYLPTLLSLPQYDGPLRKMDECFQQFRASWQYQASRVVSFEDPI